MIKVILTIGLFLGAYAQAGIKSLHVYRQYEGLSAGIMRQMQTLRLNNVYFNAIEQVFEKKSETFLYILADRETMAMFGDPNVEGRYFSPQKSASFPNDPQLQSQIAKNNTYKTIYENLLPFLGQPMLLIKVAMYADGTYFSSHAALHESFHAYQDIYYRSLGRSIQHTNMKVNETEAFLLGILSKTPHSQSDGQNIKNLNLLIEYIRSGCSLTAEDHDAIEQALADFWLNISQDGTYDAVSKYYPKPVKVSDLSFLIEFYRNTSH